MKKIYNGNYEDVVFKHSYTMFKEIYDGAGEHDGFLRVWSLQTDKRLTEGKIIDMFMNGTESACIDREGHYIIVKEILDITKIHLEE